MPPREDTLLGWPVPHGFAMVTATEPPAGVPPAASAAAATATVVASVSVDAAARLEAGVSTTVSTTAAAMATVATAVTAVGTVPVDDVARLAGGAPPEPSSAPPAAGDAALPVADPVTSAGVAARTTLWRRSTPRVAAPRRRGRPVAVLAVEPRTVLGIADFHELRREGLFGDDGRNPPPSWWAR